MSHFAELDENNLVLRVLVGDPELSDEDALQFIVENFGGRWLQTSYNGRIRKNYAGVGWQYDEVRDAFIPPQPFESWVLNEETCHWDAPVAPPTDGLPYRWNEELMNWEVIPT